MQGESASQLEAASNPVQVASTWQFETIISPMRFDEASPHWLVMDSHGYPHLAYGGDQLYYARFDGKAWSYEIASTEPGAGKHAALALDGNDSPHIVHAVGMTNKVSLVHTYHNETGWHSETIEPVICGGQDFGAQFDPQGRLTIVYSDGRPDCTDMSVYASRLRFIQQKTDGWDIHTIAQLGMTPSLAFAAGRTYISYIEGDFGILNLAMRENEAWTITRVTDGISMGGLTTSLVMDAESWPHIFYPRPIQSTVESMSDLEHA